MRRCVNTFTKPHAFKTNVFSTTVGIEDPYAELVMVVDTLDSIHEKYCKSEYPFEIKTPERTNSLGRKNK